MLGITHACLLGTRSKEASMTSLPASRRPLRKLLAGLAFAGAIGAFVNGEARADTSLAPGNGEGINTRLFRAAIDSKGFFSVNGTDVLGKGDFAFGLVLDGGFGLLRLRETSTPQGI